MNDYKPLVSSAPAHSILNAQAFHYTSSVATDIRKTFDKFRQRQAWAAARALMDAASKIRPLALASSEPIAR